MGRDAADGRAGDVHGTDHEHGRDLARAAHLPDHVLDLGHGRLALALDGDLPAVVVAGGAHGAAHVLVRDLHDQAVLGVVDLRRKLGPYPVQTGQQLRPVHHLARQFAVRHEMHGLVGQGPGGQFVDRVRGHDADHEVARVFEGIGQVFVEIALQDDHLAHAPAAAAQGDHALGEGRADLVAGLAVAARDEEGPVVAPGQAVELGGHAVADVGDADLPGLLLHAGHEAGQLLGRVGLVRGQHRHGVADLALAGEGLGLHAVQEGMLGGELPQPLDE